MPEIIVPLYLTADEMRELQTAAQKLGCTLEELIQHLKDQHFQDLTDHLQHLPKGTC